MFKPCLLFLYYVTLTSRFFPAINASPILSTSEGLIDISILPIVDSVGGLKDDAVLTKLDRARDTEQANGNYGKIFRPKLLRIMSTVSLNDEPALSQTDLQQHKSNMEAAGGKRGQNWLPTYCTAERGLTACATDTICRFFEDVGPVGWFGLMFGFMHAIGKIDLLSWGICHMITGQYGSFNLQKYMRHDSNLVYVDGLTMQTGRDAPSTVLATNERALQPHLSEIEADPKAPIESPKYCTAPGGFIRCGSELCKFFDTIGVPAWMAILFGVLHATGDINLFKLGICSVITRAIGRDISTSMASSEPKDNLESPVQPYPKTSIPQSSNSNSLIIGNALATRDARIDPPIRPSSVPPATYSNCSEKGCLYDLACMYYNWIPKETLLLMFGAAIVIYGGAIHNDAPLQGPRRMGLRICNVVKGLIGRDEPSIVIEGGEGSDRAGGKLVRRAGSGAAAPMKRRNNLEIAAAWEPGYFSG
ncbi:MAG: hypothetical protein M1812_004318 [Candelaria pacifica]|nr:MAG: hypothetical protein M1812_004318 [Candelaria pacifica]